MRQTEGEDNMCKACETKSYVGLHNHTDFSILDGYAKVDEYIEAAKEMGMIGIGLADHGTASGLFELITKSKKAGLIPVPGVEFYIAPENPLGARVRTPIFYGPGGKKAPKYDVGGNGLHLHLTVFAYNNVGLSNLFKLTSKSWEKENFYSKPRIDTNMLAEHAEGLIATTGCPSSEISTRFLLGQDKKAYEYATRMKSIFGDNYYVELMNHDMEEDLEKIILPKLIKLAKDLDIKVIATNDSHYANKKDAGPHERQLAIQTGSKMSEPGFNDGGTRFSFSGPEYYLKSYDEMYRTLPADIAEEALANTLELTHKCEGINLEYNPHLRPSIEVPEGKTTVTHLRDLILEGYKTKRANDSEEVKLESQKRIQEEFKVIHSNDFVDYFLVVHDYINWAHTNGISIGAGRGSVGGSEIAYLLDISNTDPIRFDLLFERFLSPGRGSLYQIDYIDGTSEEIAVSENKVIFNAEGNKKAYVHEIEPGDTINHGNKKKTVASIFVKVPGSAPDIDTDFHTGRRQEVIDYIINKYGHDNVANIITFDTFKAKSSFKSMCTIYEIPYATANAVTKLIPDPAEGEDMTLEDLFNPMSPRYAEGEDFRSAVEDPQWKELLEMATPFYGRINSTSVHPCFVAGTSVKTSDRYINIEDVNIGDKVLTHNNRYKTVLEVMKTPECSLYELETANSSPMKVTGNHPFYIREVIRNSKGTKVSLSSPKWVDAKDLIENEHLIGVAINDKEIMPSLNLDLPFENHDFWWVMGRFVGDGWVENFTSRRNRKRKDGTSYIYESQTKRIKISYGMEDPTSSILLEKLGSLFEYRVEDHRTANKILINESLYPDLFIFLSMFGSKAHGKFIPQVVQDLPKPLLSSFLDGYLSADGSYVQSTETYAFNTVSKELFLGLISIVNKVYNTHCRTSFEKRGPMTIEGRVVQAKDRYSAQFNKEPRQKNRSVYLDGYLWVSIKHLKKLEEKEDTYNLTVEDDSSYTVNNLIAHNCGLIISPVPISTVAPTQVRQEDNTTITQWTYPQLESLGFIKMDLLGLNSLDIIDLAVANVKKSTGKELNMRELIMGPMDDKKTYEMLQRGDTVGIFQLSGAGVRDLLKRAKPNKFMDIATITALYRPGPMSTNAHNEWADRNTGATEVVPIHKSFIGTPIEKILEPTSGILVFQEQLMQIVTQYANMTSYEADTLRKAMGKKNMNIMMSLKPKFIEGAMKNGATLELANLVWDTMEGFGQYGFNKSHSVSYAINAYQMTYLKANYPAEYMAAAIQNARSSKESTENLQETMSMGLKVGPVDINQSDVYISATNKQISDSKYDIVYGFMGIKQVNEEISSTIINERNSGGPFTSVQNFIQRVGKHVTVSKSTIANLAQAGAFDSFGVSRKLVGEKADLLVSNASKTATKGLSLFAVAGAIDQGASASIELTGEDYDYVEKIKLEADLLGYFISGHPAGNLGPVAKSLNRTTIKELKSSQGFSKESRFIIGTIANIKSKVKRNGSRSIAITIDDTTDTHSLYLPKHIVAAITKHEELKKLESRPDRVIRDNIRKLLDDSEVIPREPLEKYEVYLFEVKHRTNEMNFRMNVVNVTKLETSPNGTLPYDIRYENAKQLEELSKLIKSAATKSKKSLYVRLHYGTEAKIVRIPIRLTRELIMKFEKVVGIKNILTEGV